jgi:hypothetical protein
MGINQVNKIMLNISHYHFMPNISNKVINSIRKKYIIQDASQMLKIISPKSILFDRYNYLAFWLDRKYKNNRLTNHE